MASRLADWYHHTQTGRPQQAAWRWRYRDPITGELVSHSELLTTEQIRAIDPLAEVIPGSRVPALQSRPDLRSIR